jgi:hypothetical protein
MVCTVQVHISFNRLCCHNDGDGTGAARTGKS